MPDPTDDATPVFRELSRSHTFTLETRSTLHVRTIQLRVVEGPDKGREISATAERVTIGGHSECGLPLKDRSVSRRHAEIRVAGNGYLLVDAGSTNGTTLDGNRIESAYLSPGARIGLGRTVIEFAPVDERVDIEPDREGRLGDMIGRSIAMRQLFGLLRRVAPMDVTVLVTGETGTGKELVARALHERSARSDGPFVVVDCAAIARELVESELFGHDKGAFTGAARTREGAFELANGGTIFIDELGELPPDLQPRLLRVLEQRQVKRVGGNDIRDVDVRVIAATNRDLEEEVRAGRFREDLYYRLAVLPIHVPALRERREDVPWIVRALMRRPEMRSAGQKKFSTEALNRLMAHRWPGNVRELVNVVRRSAMLADGDEIGLTDLPPLVRELVDTRPSLSVDISVPLKEARDKLMNEFEREYLKKLLGACSGNVSEAARRCGIHRKTVERLLRKHGLERHDLRFPS